MRSGGSLSAQHVSQPASRESLLRSFGEGLRRLRRQAGLSQEELARRSGLDRTYVGGAERGERNVSLINLCRLASALDVVPSDLLALVVLEPARREG